MKSKKEILREKANALPPSPGVYLMKNAEGRVIYVGKSRRLCARVASYFTGEHTAKTARMVALVDDFDTILCDSEIEALSLENTLIKQYKPKYNIRLKDAKSYPYLAISEGEYPRIFVTRDRAVKGVRYFGPYTGTSDAYANLDTVRRLFRLPSCTRRFPEEIGRARPCLYRQMGRCMAPCTGEASAEEYRAAIRAAMGVLDGRTAAVTAQLKEEMARAADTENYELAARLRDALFSLQRLGTKQKVLSDEHTSLDAWGMDDTTPTGALSVLSVREGKLVRKNDFTFSAGEILSPEAALSFITDFYLGGADIPAEVMLGFATSSEELASLSDFLSVRRGHKAAVRQAQRGEKRALCEMAAKNAREAAGKQIARTAREEQTLLALARLLALEVYPSRIELYDISAIGEEYTTAGMIVCEDGTLKKNAYRTFRIRSVARDDYGAMREVLTRRFAHAEDEDFGAMPDLILLDGGHGHVAVGKEVLAEMGISVPLFGLVKDDYHKTRAICTESEDVSIGKEQSVFVFLYRLQEEVHRYTVRATMGAKGRSLKRSTLEDVPGIGPERARRLLAYFGNLRRIKAATEAELSAVGGMTKAAAAALYAHYHKSDSDEKGEKK